MVMMAVALMICAHLIDATHPRALGPATSVTRSPNVVKNLCSGAGLSAEFAVHGELCDGGQGVEEAGRVDVSVHDGLLASLVG